MFRGGFSYLRALRDHAVDSFGGVDGLGDVEVPLERCRACSVLAREVLFGDEEIDGFADGHFDGFIERGVEAHRDPVGGRLAARGFQLQVLADDELERADERGLHRGDIDFAISLPRVAVAHFEERAGAFTGMRGWCRRRDPCCPSCLAKEGPGGPLLTRPMDSGGATPMLPKKGRRGISILSAKLRDAAFFIEPDDLGGALGEVLRGEDAALRAESCCRRTGWRDRSCGCGLRGCRRARRLRRRWGR